MKVEKDIVVLSIPFSAGVALAAAVPLGGIALYWTAALVGVAVLLLSLIYCHKRTWDFSALAIFFCLGLMASLSAKLGYGIKTEFLNLDWALQASLDAIDQLGFKDDQTTALAKALLTGRRTELSKATIEAFRISGASHILSLSGLHMGIIYGLLQFALSWMGKSPLAKYIRSSLIIIFAFLYLRMTGASPSVVRAFLFIMIGEISRLLPGRRRRALSVLCAALLIQLCFNPLIISSVGFQLSYSAMLGIFFIYPYMKAWFEPKTKILTWIWNAACLSISCQITTSPLSWYYFRTFPLFFLLSNLVAIPLTEFFVFALLGCLALSTLGICPDFAIEICEFLAQCLIKFLTIVASL